MGEATSASDAVQEAFISAYKNLKYYRGGSFKAWLLRIVTNACYDELRRRKRRPATSLEALTVVEQGPDAETEAALVSHDELPEAYTQRRELAAPTPELPRRPARRHAYRGGHVGRDGHGIRRNRRQHRRRPWARSRARLSRARARMRECLRQSENWELLPARFSSRMKRRRHDTYSRF